MKLYECDCCGACCRNLIVEVDHLDALREVRITVEGRLLDGKGKMPLADAMWGLNNSKRTGHFGCVFIGDDNKCGIYATRPNVCVDVQAGGQKCQQARASAKLPPLEPTGTTRKPTVIQRIKELARAGE